MNEDSDEEMYIMRKESKKYDNCKEIMQERHEILEKKTDYYNKYKKLVFNTKRVVTFLGLIANNEDMFYKYVDFIIRNENFGEEHLEHLLEGNCDSKEIQKILRY